MQSTGHSSMHALSLMSTHGSAMVYVTDVSSVYCSMWAAVRSPRRSRPLRLKLSVTDTRRFIYTSTTWHARVIADLRLSVSCPATRPRFVEREQRRQGC